MSYKPTFEDLQNLAVMVVGYRQVFGEEGTANKLIEIIQRYSLEEWLNPLCMAQSVISADGEGILEVQSRLAQAVLGPECFSRLTSWLSGDGKKFRKIVLCHEPQISLVQQLCFLHAPDCSELTFANDDARDDLGKALLISNDLVTLNDQLIGEDNLVGVGIVSHFRSTRLTAVQAYSRAVQFYQLDLPQQSEACTRLFADFKVATGVEGRNYILGGQCFVWNEIMRSTEDTIRSWDGVLLSDACPPSMERDCRSAFEKVRMGSIEQMRSRINEVDRRPIPEQTLIPLSQFPLLRLDEQRGVVLNQGALGRSLFEGVRHAVLTHALTQSDRDYAIQRVGSTYGQVFEQYVGRLLRKCWGNRVIQIPHERFPGCADYIVLYPEKVLVIECKSGHFRAFDKSRIRPLQDWKEDIREKIGVGDAIVQMKNAIHLLRSDARETLDPTIAATNFDKAVFIPIVVTDEDMPFPITGWDELYSWFDVELRAICPDVVLAPRMRLVPVDELEWLIDVERFDLASLLISWAADERRYGFTFKNFVLSLGIQPGRRNAIESFQVAAEFLAKEFEIEVDLRSANIA